MISDKALAMCELTNDLLYQKIPAGKHGYYIEESLSAGRTAAKRVLKMPGYTGIEDLYQAAGIRVEYLQESKKTYGVSFRAQSEYDPDGNATVTLYQGAILDLAKSSQALAEQAISASPALSGRGGRFPDGTGQECLELTEKEALHILLAHEYFHYLEFHSSVIGDPLTVPIHDKGMMSDYLDSVEIMHLLKWKRKAGILRTSEIAAHAFAKEIAKVPYLPNYYDYTYLIAKGSIKAEDFREMIRRYEILFKA